MLLSHNSGPPVTGPTMAVTKCRWYGCGRGGRLMSKSDWRRFSVAVASKAERRHREVVQMLLAQMHLRIRRMVVVSVAVIALLVAGTTTVQATLLVGTDLPPNNGELEVGSCCVIAQPFTLTTAVRINNIAVQMSGFGSDSFTLWLTKAVGPLATPSDVLFQTPLIFPNTGGSTNGSTVNVPMSMDLSPGSYFLVASSAQPLVAQGWTVSPSTIPTPYGNVSIGLASCCASGTSTNSAFPPASTFRPGIPTFVGAFQISGVTESSLAVIPTMSYVGLLGLSLIVAVGYAVVARTRGHGVKYK